jgi:8-oxo-dGTP diphosphatase
VNVETPKLAVDCIVLAPKPDNPSEQGIVLIKRKYPPLGYAIPGGFVDIGETTQQAAIREMKEELNVDVNINFMLGIYDDPQRDPRRHVVSVVFAGTANQIPVAGDDAKDLTVWSIKEIDAIKPKLAFDHEKILKDFISTSLQND